MILNTSKPFILVCIGYYYFQEHFMNMMPIIICYITAHTMVKYYPDICLQTMVSGILLELFSHFLT